MSYAAATQAGTNSNNKIQDQQYRFEVRMRGIPESAPNTKKIERLDYEKEQVTKVLDFIGAQASLTDIRRQGAYKKDRNRNLIIRFSTVFGVESVLQNAKKPAKYDTPVFINRQRPVEDLILRTFCF